MSSPSLAPASAAAEIVPDVSEDAVAPEEVIETSSPWRSVGISVVKAALSFAVFLVLWQLLVWALAVPTYIVPGPAGVFRALANGLASGQYVIALGATVWAIVAGFAVGSAVGVILAVLLVSWPLVDRLIFPYIVALQSMPKIAIAPLMIVWFGFGFESKLIIMSLISTFPVLVNMIAGLKSTEGERLELIRALSGSRLQALWYVQLPSSLPYLFAGLSASLVLAVTGAIVAEFVGARYGIGVLIMKANFSLDITGVFALLLLLGAVAAILNLFLKLIGSFVLFWSPSGRKN